MLRRATTTIRVDDTLVLRPAMEEYSEALLEAYEETWPEVSRAMPWINPDTPFESQMQDFLAETESLSPNLRYTYTRNTFRDQQTFAKPSGIPLSMDSLVVQSDVDPKGPTRITPQDTNTPTPTWRHGC